MLWRRRVVVWRCCWSTMGRGLWSFGTGRGVQVGALRPSAERRAQQLGVNGKSERKKSCPIDNLEPVTGNTCTTKMHPVADEPLDEEQRVQRP